MQVDHSVVMFKIMTINLKYPCLVFVGSDEASSESLTRNDAESSSGGGEELLLNDELLGYNSGSESSIVDVSKCNIMKHSGKCKPLAYWTLKIMT